MNQPYVIMPRSPSAIVEDQIGRLFKRCWQCPATLPTCNCQDGQTCSMVPAGCYNCAYTTCIGTPTASPGPPVAAIAGGVVGGLIALGLLVLLAWWMRRKRNQEMAEAAEIPYEPEEWDNATMSYEKDDHDRYSSRMNQRASTHTVASTLSAGRLSNVIQIAYIPGVTNRSHSTPDLIPPVPPIPAAASGGSSRLPSGGSSRASQADQLLFLPGDFGRNSTYSDYSARDSVAVGSRNSVASTIYRNDAIVNPMPAQAVNLIKPTAVSLKTSNRGTPAMSRSSSPPPVELSSRGSSIHRPLNTKSSIVGKFAQPRAITVTRKNSQSLKPHGHTTFELDGGDHSVSSVSTSLHQKSGAASPSQETTFDYGSSDDESGQSSRLVELPAAKTPTHANTNPIYSRPSELAGSSTTLRDSGISRAIQDSMTKAMQTSMGAPSTPPEMSPFSDAHEAKTP